jgi:hypothetical protein
MAMLLAMHAMAGALRFWYFGSEKRVGVTLMQLPPVEVYTLRMDTFNICSGTIVESNTNTMPTILLSSPSSVAGNTV